MIDSFFHSVKMCWMILLNFDHPFFFIKYSVDLG